MKEKCACGPKFCRAVVVGAGPAGLTAAAEVMGGACELVVLEKDENS